MNFNNPYCSRYLAYRKYLVVSGFTSGIVQKRAERKRGIVNKIIGFKWLLNSKLIFEMQ
jgi:hypothetical protein